MKKQIFLACALSISALPALAEGFYLSGDIGRGKMEVDASDDSTYSKTSTAYSIGVGYDINKFFAVEFAYRDLGSVTDRGTYLDIDNINYSYRDEVSASAIQASIIGSLPISDEFSVFGRVGLAKIDMDYDSVETGAGETWRDSDSESETKGLFGIGASYQIAPQVALRAEYNQFAKWDNTKLSAISIGATYHF